jgi:pyrroline-5-carboxylate reductase
MGEAMVTGLVRSRLVEPERIVIADANQARVALLAGKFGVGAAPDNRELVRACDLVLLAVKPKVVGDVLRDVKGLWRTDQILVSIAAGIPTASLEELAGVGLPVVRVMPNTPCLVGEGASAVSPGRYAGDEHVAEVKTLFRAVGLAVQVEESLMDAVTGLSGSGPAYMFLICEALCDAGVRLGLTRQVALSLAAQTMLGAARMILTTGEHPAELKNRVTTPAGTTAEGLLALEKGGLRVVLDTAVHDAAGRSREMSRS